ncbi:hypothetical protein T459_18695 [Capsicum annuum]|uniref:40S ribosomal protein SA n=1 Tax=Capsicum annuum TaxID=4072 RepID=A0A2G2YZM9_CAPAN|nr:hypothetical protein FXO37_20455 [Capsicum annuum]PHT75173.1 hypothetical protein T459_18695 [Capsicum annuum]
MRYVDIGIPANNKGNHCIGFLSWILAREPEEETPTFADYADHSSGGAIGGDWSTGQIFEAQWTADAAAPVPSVGGWDEVDDGTQQLPVHQLPYQ